MKPNGHQNSCHTVGVPELAHEQAPDDRQAMNLRAGPPRRLIVLGSTGSIGVNTLKVVEHLNRSATDSVAKIDVVGLAAGAMSTS